jgi:hypothetical protein
VVWGHSGWMWTQKNDHFVAPVLTIVQKVLTTLTKVNRHPLYPGNWPPSCVWSLHFQLLPALPMTWPVAHQAAFRNLETNMKTLDHTMEGTLLCPFTHQSFLVNGSLVFWFLPYGTIGPFSSLASSHQLFLLAINFYHSFLRGKKLK